MVLRVGDIEIARGIHGQPLRSVELRAGSRAAVARGTGGAGAGESGDHALAIHAPHHIVCRVRDIRIARGIHRDAERRVDLRGGSRAAVARTAHQPVTGNRADIAAGQFADAIVQRVGKVNVSGGIHRHTRGQAHLDLVRRAAVSGKALVSIADRRGDVPLGVDLANAVGAELGDVHVAAGIRCHAERGHHRQCGRGAVAREARAAAYTGDGGDDAGR